MKKLFTKVIAFVMSLTLVCASLPSLSMAAGASVDVELQFSSVEDPNGGKNWGFSHGELATIPADWQWFKMDALVDGEARTVLVQYTVGVSKFYIYGHCFDETPSSTGRAPASSFQIAQGAVLTPLTGPDASAVDANGQTYTVSKAVHVVCDTVTGEWFNADSLPISITWNFSTVLAPDGAKNWEFSHSGSDTLPEHAQWFKLSTEVDGEARTALVQFDSGVSKFYIYGHCFDITPSSAERAPGSSFAVAKGALLTPLTEPNASSVDESARSYRIANKISVLYNGDTSAWEADDDTSFAMELSFASVEAPTGGKNWGFTYTCEETMPTDWQWFKMDAEVDGEVRTVLVQYSAGVSKFYIYGHCFDTTPSNTGRAPATSFKIAKGTKLIPISEPDASKVVADGQTYKVTNNVSVVYKDGIWGGEAAEVNYTTYRLDELGLFDLGDQPNYSRLAITLRTPVDLPYPTEYGWWGTYSNSVSTVEINGTPYSALLGCGGESDLLVFYINWGGTANLFDTANSIVIKADTCASVGEEGFKLEDDLEIVKDGIYWRINGNTAEDDNMRYATVDSRNMELLSCADNDGKQYSIFQLKVADQLPDYVWDEFEGKVHIFIDDIEYVATLKKSESINGFDLIMPYTEKVNKVITSASKVVIPDGIIALATNRKIGVKFNGRQEICKADDTWALNYEYNRVELTFDNFDGRGFYLNAEIVDGPDKGESVVDLYGAWNYPTPMGDITYDRNGTDVSMSVFFSPCNESQLYISGNYQGHIYEVQGLTVAEGTVITPYDATKCKTPLYVERAVKLAKVGTEEFADTMMLDIKIQDNSRTAPVGSDKYDLRFIASVNSLIYKNAGFVFSLENEVPTKNGSKCAYRETSKVYQSINAGEKKYGVEELYNSYSKYLYAFEITDVPANQKIYARAYVELLNGTYIYGDVREVTAPGIK